VEAAALLHSGIDLVQYLSACIDTSEASDVHL
jgi:hypothetical protein